jgi:hypothetical protein
LRLCQRSTRRRTVSSAAASSQRSIHLPPVPQGSPGLQISASRGSTLPRADSVEAASTAAAAAATASSAAVEAVCCVPSEPLRCGCPTEQDASAEPCGSRCRRPAAGPAPSSPSSLLPPSSVALGGPPASSEPPGGHCSGMR